MLVTIGGLKGKMIEGATSFLCAEIASGVFTSSTNLSGTQFSASR